MRKFSVRWWVVNPLERHERAIAELTGDCGVSVRYVREATDEDVRFFIWGWFATVKPKGSVQ